ncbi:transposase [Shewanella electrodiphila]|uniref:transposase n=1 Tax=Shewanella electrodiphila TaxID=934143 RepID=UPI003D160C15
MTNLQSEEFSSKDVMKLYRIRWLIELLFKEWKSHNNLKKICNASTTSGQRVDLD